MKRICHPLVHFHEKRVNRYSRRGERRRDATLSSNSHTTSLNVWFWRGMTFQRKPCFSPWDLWLLSIKGPNWRYRELELVILGLRGTKKVRFLVARCGLFQPAACRTTSTAQARKSVLNLSLVYRKEWISMLFVNMVGLKNRIL